MTQKESIVKLLRNNGAMTQCDLSIAIYGDNKHMPNIYASLMALVNQGHVLRHGQKPSYYSISKDDDVSIVPNHLMDKTKDKTLRDISSDTITDESISEIDSVVEQDSAYGEENRLITDCFKSFLLNTDINIVAMKIGLIDITNSTNISRYKSKISVVELANIISTIPDIDNRIKCGDPDIVNIIARNTGK